jgi:hypothetical protein
MWRVGVKDASGRVRSAFFEPPLGRHRASVESGERAQPRLRPREHPPAQLHGPQIPTAPCSKPLR